MFLFGSRGKFIFNKFSLKSLLLPQWKKNWIEIKTLVDVLLFYWGLTVSPLSSETDRSNFLLPPSPAVLGWEWARQSQPPPPSWPATSCGRPCWWSAGCPRCWRGSPPERRGSGRRPGGRTRTGPEQRCRREAELSGRRERSEVKFDERKLQVSTPANLEGDTPSGLSQQLLQTLYWLVSNTDPVNFSNFIAHVKCGLGEKSKELFLSHLNYHFNSHFSGSISLQFSRMFFQFHKMVYGQIFHFILYSSVSSHLLKFQTVVGGLAF